MSWRRPFIGKRLQSTAASPPRRRIVPKLLGTGIAGTYLYYMWDNYRDAKAKEPATGIPAHTMTAYRLFPVNAMTRLAGWAASLQVPTPLRSPLFGLYAGIFGCNMVESERSFPDFTTFNDFFTRRLKVGARPIDPDADLCSPADGRVTALGRIDVPFVKDSNGHPLIFPEQIKGHTYPMDRLLDEATYRAMIASSSKPLYYCTIYLSPGSYHRFHSAAGQWRLSRDPVRISGEALSVAPWMMRWVSNLFCLNERVILGGTWKHGHLAMIPVGATNVRSIKLEDSITQGKSIAKAEEVGRFELGSTVVLLFQAPADFRWEAQVGQPIKVGEALGSAPRRYYLINGLI
jgi:phosphatidylserine decarboxylase